MQSRKVGEIFGALSKMFPTIENDLAKLAELHENLESEELRAQTLEIIKEDAVHEFEVAQTKARVARLNYGEAWDRVQATRGDLAEQKRIVAKKIADNLWIEDGEIPLLDEEGINLKKYQANWHAPENWLEAMRANKNG